MNGRTVGAARLLRVAVWTAACCAAAASADMVGHGGLVRAIALSADGSLALTASFDHSVRLWRFEDQSEVKPLEGHEGPVNGVAFADAGRRGVSVGADGNVMVWDIANGSPLRVLRAHRGRVMSVSVSADGHSALTSGWDGSLLVWDLERGRVDRSYVVHPGVTAAIFGPADRRIIAGMRDGLVRVLRRSDGEEVLKFRAHDISLTQIVSSGDRNRLLTIGHDGRARVWRSEDFTEVARFAMTPPAIPIAAALSVDGSGALVGYSDGRVLHLDADTAQVRRALRVGDGPVWAVAFTPDGRFGLTAGRDERVKVWHLESGDRLDVSSDEPEERPRPWLTSRHPGARVFRKCAVCHALTREERQRAGPHFTGLFGRRAGTAAGYRYSQALQHSDVVWTRSTIAELFRQGPDRYLPGTKMPVQEIRDRRRLDDLIDYLEQIVPPG